MISKWHVINSSAQVARYCLLTVCALVFVFPVGWVLLSSLKTNLSISAGPFVTPHHLHWENYVNAWGGGGFAVYIGNSLFIGLVSTLIVVATSALAAYSFAKLNFRGRTVLFFLFFVGMTVPDPIVVGPLMSEIYALKLVNTRWSLILPYSAAFLPFGILTLRAFFRDLPDEVIDAAKIDGAGTLRTVFDVVVPLAMPAVFVLIVLTFLNCWREFYYAVILLSRASSFTVPLGLMQFESTFTTNYQLQFAGIVIAAIIPIAVYLAFQRSFLQGVAAGSFR